MGLVDRLIDAREKGRREAELREKLRFYSFATVGFMTRGENPLLHEAHNKAYSRFQEARDELAEIPEPEGFLESLFYHLGELSYNK